MPMVHLSFSLEELWLRDETEQSQQGVRCVSRDYRGRSLWGSICSRLCGRAMRRGLLGGCFHTDRIACSLRGDKRNVQIGLTSRMYLTSRMCGLVVASHGRFLRFWLWLCVRTSGGGAAEY